MEALKLNTIEKEILNIRNQKVLLDSSLARLYEVETRAINQAVARNPEKFPQGYLIELTDLEWNAVRSQIVISPRGGGRAYKPKAFTEKGLYMLATLLRGPKSTQATMHIIETFAQVREIKRAVIDVIKNAENHPNQKKIIEHVGSLTGKLIMPDEDDFETVEIQTDAKFKFMGVLEFSKKIIKRPKK